MEFEAYLMDLDGTVYLGETLFPGVRETICRIRTSGKRVVFLSNNPLRTREDYVRKLTGMGISVTLNEIINSSYVLCLHLKQLQPGAVVFPIGENALARELLKHGFRISDHPEEIEYVIASFDRTFRYEKLVVALRAIERGARFIATNPDRTCPFENGELPDAGAVIGAIWGMTGKEVEWVAGKPSPIMANVILKKLDLLPEQILMIGDRLQTDIAFGRCGFKTALVLSGITKREDLRSSLWQPDYVYEGLWRLFEDPLYICEE